MRRTSSKKENWEFLGRSYNNMMTLSSHQCYKVKGFLREGTFYWWEISAKVLAGEELRSCHLEGAISSFSRTFCLALPKRLESRVRVSYICRFPRVPCYSMSSCLICPFVSFIVLLWVWFVSWLLGTIGDSRVWWQGWRDQSGSRVWASLPWVGD